MDSDKRIGLVVRSSFARTAGCGSAGVLSGPPELAGASAGTAILVCEHNVLRDVDYCSGAALLVRAEAFHRVGGFDTRYAPGCYEDIDHTFALRTAGYRTVVQPKAVPWATRACPTEPVRPGARSDTGNAIGVRSWTSGPRLWLPST